MLSEAPGMRSFLISEWDVTLWQIQLVSRYFIRYGSVGQYLIFNALKFACLNAPQGWSQHAPNMRPFLGWAWSQISKNLGIFRWTLCPAAKLRRSIFVQRYGWYDQGEYTTISHSTLPILLAYKIQDMTWHLSFLNPFEWLECLNLGFKYDYPTGFNNLLYMGKDSRVIPHFCGLFN